MSAKPEQPELIDDDPRQQIADVLEEWRESRRVAKEQGGLLTSRQAARILGVTPNQVTVWMAKGRLTVWCFLGNNLVSAGEVLALYKERRDKGVRLYYCGNPAPPLSGLAPAALEAFGAGL